ncbi:MAG: stimulus-sensing domain-containing protein [Magnetospiraceae bacterium]
MALRRHLFPITRRILAVNILALGILVAGVLSLGEYRRNLVDQELQAMASQAEMFAAALGEGAVIAADPGSTLIARETARRMVRRLVETSKVRARLFSVDGDLIVDTRYQSTSDGSIRQEVLPPPGQEETIAQAFFNLYNEIISFLPREQEDPPPIYEELADQRAIHYGEVSRALLGRNANMIRLMNDGSRLLSVAVPVQRYKRVLGAVMLSTDDSKVNQSVSDVRVDILRISAIILGVTVGLSLYLAGTIASPLRRLSRAAETLRETVGRHHVIPDLSKRGDEIGDLSASLREMTEALWQRMDAVDRFAADVAHEIKNPLTSLRSAVETIARVKDPEQQRKLLSILEDDVRRLDRLISDISAASRLDSELSRDEVENVDLGRLLDNVVDAYTAMVEGEEDATPPVVLTTKGAKLPAVRGTEGRLGQVIRNLVDNAMTFSPPGSPVRLSAQRDSKMLTLFVDDDGPGIPPGKESKIFDRFYSERPSEEDFGTHSGLGLAIARQIIETYGGQLTAENRLRPDGDIAGARFTVRLKIIG